MAQDYVYTKIFDPSIEGAAVKPERRAAGDRRDGEVYLYTPELTLAINVAMATARPLLVRGPSGTGKSSMAVHVAQRLGWRYYDEVISSATQARDLLWRFDALRRLSDAQAGKDYPLLRYVEPSVLWWAFDRASAKVRGGAAADPNVPEASDPSRVDSDGAVVLLDEIDKADPDVPNNLLVPIGSLEFTVREGALVLPVKAKATPLVIITTNEERELPSAFLRRCVTITLSFPGAERLVEIAGAHFGPDDAELHRSIAAIVIKMRAKKKEEGGVPPSTAEYLDAVAVCRNLNIAAAGSSWESVALAVLDKPRPESDLLSSSYV
jgi:MoxR-like ATPase